LVGFGQEGQGGGLGFFHAVEGADGAGGIHHEDDQAAGLLPLNFFPQIGQG